MDKEKMKEVVGNLIEFMSPLSDLKILLEEMDQIEVAYNALDNERLNLKKDVEVLREKRQDHAQAVSNLKEEIGNMEKNIRDKATTLQSELDKEYEARELELDNKLQAKESLIKQRTEELNKLVIEKAEAQKDLDEMSVVAERLINAGTAWKKDIKKVESKPEPELTIESEDETKDDGFNF